MSYPPTVSKISTHKIEEIPHRNFNSFEIAPSHKGSKLNLQLTPDFALCTDCAEELTDPENRRYHYPFTTCVNCGPRWAITNTFPFERDHTGMVEFPMCETCEKEYANPQNRRFHSQTNSCPSCGITLTLTDHKGVVLECPRNAIFNRLVKLLTKGNIIALKNTNGYLLCCDATNPLAVRKLRNKKNRPNKPFAILYPNAKMLQKELVVTPKELEILSSTERPIVIIPKIGYNGNLALDELAPNLNQLGIMVPYTGVLQLLATALTMPIVATSGNIHGSPIISDSAVAVKTLYTIADYFVHHDLPISHPQDDSVVKYSRKYGQEVILRRARGYAPNYFGKEHPGNKKILAMGGHVKSTIGFLPNAYIYLSQYLGNLDDYDVYQRLETTTSRFMELFEQEPERILVDAHPAYQSTQYGLELGKKYNAEVIKIQHHKAHFASVLGEHGLFDAEMPVLGVIWDGAGYGDDGQIWGGEFFVYYAKQIQRTAHFEYFDWLAGDKMAREPRLSLLSLANEGETPLYEKFTREELALYKSLKKKNYLKTSSVGRLFDAVASALDICDFNTYEGEAAILLENCIEDYDLASCTTYLGGHDISETIPADQLLTNLLADLKTGVEKEVIICNFLYTLATLILDFANSQNIKSIALSGGVFQNTILIDMLIELAKDRYKLFFNRNLSPNDENISFGQLNYYLYGMHLRLP